MRGGDGIEHLLGLFPLIVADQSISKIDAVIIGGVGMFDNGLPCGDGLGRAAGAGERFGKAAAQVDPFRLARKRAAEIGDGLFGVCDGEHHIVEVALVDDVDVLHGLGHDLIACLLAGGEGQQSGYSGQYRDGMAHLPASFCCSSLNLPAAGHSRHSCAGSIGTLRFLVPENSGSRPSWRVPTAGCL